MKILSILILSLLVFNCSSGGKKVFWCGDHACINKKERQAYFKKNLIVEVKELKSRSKEEKLEMEKILSEARINEKKRINNEKISIKETKLNEKIKKREQKLLKKEEGKKRKAYIKEQKRLEKEKLKKAKMNKKKQQVVTKKEKNKFFKKKNKVNEPLNNEENVNTFGNIVKKIINRNKGKSYPDINTLGE